MEPGLIVVNGCPKSGTHAVMSLLDTMGLRRCPGTILPMGDGLYVDGAPVISLNAVRVVPDNCFILAHVPAKFHLNDFKIITVIRDPRNVLISYCRYRKRMDGLVLTPEQALRDFWGAPFVETYQSYLGWIGKSIIIRYEDMSSPMIGDGAGIYRSHDRDWNTHTGQPSNWIEHWNDKTEAIWQSIGGPQLVSQAGYV